MHEAEAWQRYFNKAALQVRDDQNEDEWDKLYAQEEEEKSFEFVQTQNIASSVYEHDNDTDDIPDGLDPILIGRKSHNMDSTLVQDDDDVIDDYAQVEGTHKRGEPYRTREEKRQDLIQQKEDMRMESFSNDVQTMMDQQAKEDVTHVQLSSSWDIPHE